MFKTTKNLAALIFILFLAAACSRDGSGLLGSKAGPGADGDAGLSVWIIPDEPTAASELLAVVSGAPGGVSYRWEVNGSLVEGAASERFGSRPGVAGLSAGDTVTVTVLAGGMSSSGSVLVKNAPPVVTAIRIMPEPARAGADVQAVPVASDLDNDHVRFGYRWFVNGAEEVSAAGAVLPGGTFKRGDTVSVKVTPTDGVDFGKSFGVSFTVPNAPPRFVTAPPPAFEARRYSYRAEAEDPDGDAVKYLLVDGPEGMKIDPDGLLTWSITAKDGGVHRVTVAATDVLGQRATQSYEIAVEVPER